MTDTTDTETRDEYDAQQYVSLFLTRTDVATIGLGLQVLANLLTADLGALADVARIFADSSGDENLMIAIGAYIEAATEALK